MTGILLPVHSNKVKWNIKLLRSRVMYRTMYWSWKKLRLGLKKNLEDLTRVRVWHWRNEGFSISGPPLTSPFLCHFFSFAALSSRYKRNPKVHKGLWKPGSVYRRKNRVRLRYCPSSGYVSFPKNCKNSIK